MALQIELNFDKPTISKGILEILSQNLKEDPDRDVLKLSLRDSLAIIAKGNKLQYGPANHLLVSILKILNLEDSAVEDEITSILTQSSQIEEGESQPPLTQQTQETSKGAPEGDDQFSTKSVKPVCKFYANGKCRFSKECRFQHPKICQKFRNHGDRKSDQKGCDGKCNEFHPNVCRNSLKNKACPYKECRFYHLKGTKTMEHDSAKKLGTSKHGQKTAPGNASKNWNQEFRNQEKKGKFESKNRYSVLEQSPASTHQVSQSDKSKLDSTLDMIMRELADIRNWQKARTEAPQANSQHMFRPQAPINASIPMVPQPVSQWSTQDQHMAWNSPNY